MPQKLTVEIEVYEYSRRYLYYALPWGEDHMLYEIEHPTDQERRHTHQLCTQVYAIPCETEDDFRQRIYHLGQWLFTARDQLAINACTIYPQGRIRTEGNPPTYIHEVCFFLPREKEGPQRFIPPLLSELMEEWRENNLTYKCNYAPPLWGKEGMLPQHTPQG